MPSIRVNSFSGIEPETSPRNLQKNQAQIAHNVLLRGGKIKPLPHWIMLRANLGISDYTALPRVNFASSRRFQYLEGGPWGRSRAIFGDDFIEPGTSIKPISVLPPQFSYQDLQYVTAFPPSRPVTRMYGATLVRKDFGISEESTLVLVGLAQNPTVLLYENSIANITVNLVNNFTGDNMFIRFYKSISEMSTGEQPVNKLDTDWHLVAELPVVPGVNIQYSDMPMAHDSPLDLYLAGRFEALPFTPDFFKLTESGWGVAVSADGWIAISERYLLHAWPVENRFYIPESITDVSVSYDTLFIGTTGRPYVLSLAVGEKLGLQANLVPSIEDIECKPRTMARIPSGAVYTSPQGVTLITRDGMRAITRSLLSSIDSLYSERVIAEDDTSTLLRYRLPDTIAAGAAQGWYLGFIADGDTVQVGIESLPTVSRAFLLSLDDSVNGERPWQKLSTLDTPKGYVVDAFVAGGAHAVSMERGDDEQAIYVLPLPNSSILEYRYAAKQEYRWKSKKFVMPGTTTFAAAKVVHDCDGELRIKIFVDCCCKYETVVRSCEPFRLPSQLAGVEWEFELQGRATVHEVHLAGSMRELIDG